MAILASLMRKCDGMIKVVLIDIDDTLLDFDLCAKDSIQKASEELQIPLPEEFFPLFWKINDGLWKELEKGKLTLAQLSTKRWDVLFANYHIDFDSAVFDTYYRKYLSLSGIHVQGAEEVLAYLSQKYAVYSASNGPYKQQLQRLEISGLSKYIKGNFISEKIGFAKPTKEYFSYCLAQLVDVKKEEIIMIGDSLSADMKGAHDFGLKCIWYNRLHEIVEEVCADNVVENMIDIKNIL